MTLATKGTRLITLNGHEYRWLGRQGKHYSVSLFVERSHGSGQLLITQLPADTTVTPWLVMKVIDYALGQGWQPQPPGKDWMLRVYDILQTQQDWDTAPKFMGTGMAILNTWNPSPTLLKRWAYDEMLCLQGDEEDLVLHSPEYLSVLVPLADDAQCPKADYILMTLAHYLQHQTLNAASKGTTTTLLGEAITLTEQSTRAPIKKWADLLKRQWQYLKRPGPISSLAQAQSIAEDMLNGIEHRCDIRLMAETEHQFEFGFTASSFPLNRERLTIEKATGTFIYSRS